jgi:hypothetical protein
MKRLLGVLVFAGCMALAGMSAAHAQEVAPVTCAARQAEPPASWAMAAFLITTRYETGKRPAAIDWGTDGQGLSIGAVQWNMGQGTLWEFMRHVNKEAVANTMPRFHDEWWRQARLASEDKNKRKAAVEWVTSTLASPDADTFRAEVLAFVQHPLVIDAQRIAIAQRTQQAWTFASELATSAGACSPPFWMFAMAFDLSVQSVSGYQTALRNALGGLQKAGGPASPAFVGPPERPLRNRLHDAVLVHAGAGSDCGRYQGQRGHIRDAADNCYRWLQPIDGLSVTDPPEMRWHFLQGVYTASTRVLEKYKAIFFNRKGTLVLGFGAVNGTYCNYQSLYSELEAGTAQNSPRVLSNEDIDSRILQACRQTSVLPARTPAPPSAPTPPKVAPVDPSAPAAPATPSDTHTKPPPPPAFVGPPTPAQAAAEAVKQAE